MDFAIYSSFFFSLSALYTADCVLFLQHQMLAMQHKTGIDLMGGFATSRMRLQRAACDCILFSRVPEEDDNKQKYTQR
jgi:hypothetical protein